MRLVALLFILLSGMTHAAEPISLLFVGSSSTYWNDFPREVANLVNGRLTGHIDSKVISEIVGRSGSDIRVYLEPGFNRYEYGVKSGQTFLDKIREEKPAFVVLQTVCRFIMGDDDPTKTGEAHAKAITTYCEAIRTAGGEPVFFEMGWGRTPREEEGRERILDLALKNKIRLFAPCSTAWAHVYRERPELALQHPLDGSHPGDAGHFLNLACFYAALTCETPVGKLPRTFPVWPHGQFVADKAKTATFQPDAYQSKMPKWMFKLMAVSQTATLDEDTAAYLEGVAWRAFLESKKRLEQAGGQN